MNPTAQVDVMAVLASLQEQVERLTATVQAQQRTLDALAESRPPRDS
jgi:hypothetical protein